MPDKILVIDDEPDIIKYLTSILTDCEYDVKSAVSGKQGFEIIRTWYPDLICLDIMMPEETGLSFYEKLKCDKNFRNIPVIIVSGVAQSQEFDFHSYLSDNSIPPPDHFMEKPISVGEFVSTIKRLIESQSSPKRRSRK